jgi:hypothetical protein
MPSSLYEAFPNDPSSRPGFFAPSSSVDWCEPNYLHSPYIAEFFNVLSSLAILGVAVYGVVQGSRNGWQRKTLLPFALMAVVGLGSALFHATLQRSAQAADELPMLYAATSLLYLGLEPGVRPRRPWLAPALVLYCALTTAAYVLSDSFFPFFLFTYIALVLTQFYLGVRLAADAQASQPYATRLLYSSAAIYLAGFSALWSVLAGWLAGWLAGPLCPRTDLHLHTTLPSPPPPTPHRLPDFFNCPQVQRYSLHSWFHISSCIGPWLIVNFFSLVVHDRAAPPPARLVMYGGCLPMVEVTVVAGEEDAAPVTTSRLSSSSGSSSSGGSSSSRSSGSGSARRSASKTR